MDMASVQELFCVPDIHVGKWGLLGEAVELLLNLTLELDTDGDTEGEVGFGLNELGGI